MADWQDFTRALDFAVEHLASDPDPVNDREEADRSQYVLRILAAVAQSSTLRFDPERPAFLPMLETVRYLGAAGPDIDYDVAALRPGGRYVVRGERGGATYVGIAVYAGSGESGATSIVASVDVDDVAAADGTFEFEVAHPQAVRVIVRQYFHDRSTQRRGRWTIDLLDSPAHGSMALPTEMEMKARVANAAQTVRWNARLNTLWTPDRRQHPNQFVRQTSADIVAAVPNPDVVYSFAWWKIAEGEAFFVDFRPPPTNYWALQICDRWFQCFPDRRTNLNDRQVEFNPDGSVTIVIADGDPGHPNWLDTGGHRIGTAFFRWLHSDVESQPTARVMTLNR